jgi:hypothetical protein
MKANTLTELEVPSKLCGKPFGQVGLETVREELNREPSPNRAEMARRLCARLGWHDLKGRPQLMSARVGLLRLDRAGHITLPAPTKTNGNGRLRSALKGAGISGAPVAAAANELAPLVFEKVRGRTGRSREWNGLIERHHYLGYAPVPGAQARYFVKSASGRDLALISFGASAWKVAARDRFIGWDDEQRRGGLARVLNNARFLILPWVRSPNLASMILGACARVVAEDFEREHGVRVLLLESFVERGRFAGTCYRAAGWILAGTTRGRGRNDRLCRGSLPPKDVWLRPLGRDWRGRMQRAQGTQTQR